MSATRRRAHPRFPWHTWVGLTILVVAEAAILRGAVWTATWFTPIQWTGYILLIDGLVFRLCGASWLTSHRREFPFLILASVGIWLLFEAFNLYLRNWLYLGVPPNPWVRDFAYLWSFATIAPGVFETADLLHAAARGSRATVFPRGTPRPHSHGRWWIAGGLALVGLPLLLPADVAAYLFGLVWLGFIPLLEAVNARTGAASLTRDGRSGGRTRVLALLGAGILCGLLWETWNYQALIGGGAYWVYTLPEALRPFGLHFGRMPVLGLLGFPPFAVELYAFYALLREAVGGDRRLLGTPTPALRQPDGD